MKSSILLATQVVLGRTDKIVIGILIVLIIIAIIFVAGFFKK